MRRQRIVRLAVAAWVAGVAVYGEMPDVEIEMLRPESELAAPVGLGEAVRIDGGTIVVPSEKHAVATRAKVDGRNAEASKGGPVLTAIGACPGLGTLLVSNGTPNGPVAIARGEALGATVVPAGPCVGVELGIARAGLAEVMVLDEEGSWIWVRSLSPLYCGNVLQAIDLTTCAAGNVERLPVSAVAQTLRE